MVLRVCVWGRARQRAFLVIVAGGGAGILRLGVGFLLGRLFGGILGVFLYWGRIRNISVQCGEGSLTGKELLGDWWWG